MARQRLPRPRGAAAVEFALLLPLLMLVVMGTIDWGWYFYTREVVVNAAREGARAGTLQSSDSKSVSKAREAALNYLAHGVKPGGASVSAGVNVLAAGGAGVPATKAVWVEIDYTVPSITGFLEPPLIAERVLARAEMRK